jgi:hypothetical protein
MLRSIQNCILAAAVLLACRASLSTTFPVIGYIELPDALHQNMGSDE